MDKIPCLRAYTPSGIRTHDPLIMSREHESIYYSAPTMHCIIHLYTTPLKNNQESIVYCVSFSDLLTITIGDSVIDLKTKIFSMQHKGYYRQVRARRALLQINDVPLRTRRALLPLTLYSDSALLVLNGTSLSCNNTLLALN